MFLTYVIDYLLVEILRNDLKDVEIDKKYIPYNHKETKIDGIEPKHRGILATKCGFSNQ